MSDVKGKVKSASLAWKSLLGARKALSRCMKDHATIRKRQYTDVARMYNNFVYERGANEDHIFFEKAPAIYRDMHYNDRDTCHVVLCRGKSEKQCTEFVLQQVPWMPYQEKHIDFSQMLWSILHGVQVQLKGSKDNVKRALEQILENGASGVQQMQRTPENNPGGRTRLVFQAAQTFYINMTIDMWGISEDTDMPSTSHAVLRQFEGIQSSPFITITINETSGQSICTMECRLRTVPDGARLEDSVTTCTHMKMPEEQRINGERDRHVTSHRQTTAVRWKKDEGCSKADATCYMKRIFQIQLGVVKMSLHDEMASQSGEDAFVKFKVSSCRYQFTWLSEAKVSMTTLSAIVYAMCIDPSKEKNARVVWTRKFLVRTMYMQQDASVKQKYVGGLQTHGWVHESNSGMPLFASIAGPGLQPMVTGAGFASHPQYAAYVPMWTGAVMQPMVDPGEVLHTGKPFRTRYKKKRATGHTPTLYKNRIDKRQVNPRRETHQHLKKFVQRRNLVAKSNPNKATALCIIPDDVSDRMSLETPRDIPMDPIQQSRIMAGKLRKISEKIHESSLRYIQTPMKDLVGPICMGLMDVVHQLNQKDAERLQLYSSKRRGKTDEQKERKRLKPLLPRDKSFHASAVFSAPSPPLWKPCISQHESVHHANRIACRLTPTGNHVDVCNAILASAMA
jgi:hypothetical protein